VIALVVRNHFFDTKVIGYDVSEVLDSEPSEFFVTRIMHEKRACARCIEQGVATAPTPVRIAPKSIFSDETIIGFLIGKYADYVGFPVMWCSAPV
jgi:transposase